MVSLRYPLWRLIFRTAVSMLAVFYLTANLIWWGSRTQRLVTILDGELLAIAFGHVVPALWLWFTGLLALLVIPPVISMWVAWRHRAPLALLTTGLLALITHLLYRWGAGFFPLVIGPGGYYIRIVPFGQ